MLGLAWPEISDLWQVTEPLQSGFPYLQNVELQQMLLSLPPLHLLFCNSIILPTSKKGIFQGKYNYHSV